MTRLVVHSYAKINLGLKILGKRSDGFHDLESQLQSISLFDEISFEQSASAGIFFDTDKEFEIPDNENLVVLAAKLFYKTLNLEPQIAIKLVKTIPMGAGLGGGSGNAAATLCALNILENQPFDAEQLTKLATELGSDVPFFIEGGCAIARGRGEILEPKKSASEFVFGVALVPELGLNTPDVYGEYRRLIKLDEWKPLNRAFQNDLEPAALSLQPMLNEVTDFLDSVPNIRYGLSGSGSAYFALFDSADLRDKFLEEAGRLSQCRVLSFEFTQCGSEMQMV